MTDRILLRRSAGATPPLVMRPGELAYGTDYNLWLGDFYGNPLPVGRTDARLPLAYAIPGRPPINTLYHLVQAIPVLIPAGLAGTRAYAGTPTTNPAPFTLNRLSGGVSTPLGILTLTGAALTISTPANQGAMALAPGDVLQLISPNPQDPTLANVGITLLASKS